MPPSAPPRGNMVDSAHARLHQMLVTHQLRPDHPLSERLLAAELGISRTPLREAMRRLEGEGLLERLPGGLLRVRRMGVEEFLEVLHLRRLLEAEAAALAAGRMAAEALAALEDRVEALLLPAPPMEQRLADRLRLDLDLHAAIAQAAGSATLHQMLADLRRRMLLFATPPAPEALEDICDQYRAILAALRQGDAEAARAAMAAHVDRLRAGILKRLSSL